MLIDTNVIRSLPFTLPTTWKGAKIINRGILAYSAQGIEAHTYPQILEARNPS
jgi:hypothetical protein